MTSRTSSRSSPSFSSSMRPTDPSRIGAGDPRLLERRYAIELARYDVDVDGVGTGVADAERLERAPCGTASSLRHALPATATRPSCSALPRGGLASPTRPLSRAGVATGNRRRRLASLGLRPPPTGLLVRTRLGPYVRLDAACGRSHSWTGCGPPCEPELGPEPSDDEVRGLSGDSSAVAWRRTNDGARWSSKREGEPVVDERYELSQMPPPLAGEPSNEKADAPGGKKWLSLGLPEYDEKALCDALGGSDSAPQ